MKLTLQKSSVNSKSEIQITGSKSESNRLLLLQALYSDIKIKNLSTSKKEMKLMDVNGKIWFADFLKS